MNADTTKAALPPCPRCRTRHVIRNGSNRGSRPSFLCRGCGRRFVGSPRKGPAGDERKALVLRLLGERTAVRAIARVTGLPRSWLQRSVNDLHRERTPREPGPLPKNLRRQT